MELIKEQRLIEMIQSSPNIKAFRIIAPTKAFELKFERNTSKFFRSLKNGLNSLHGISNRHFFKNLSGCYFSLQKDKTIEIILFYDSTIRELNETQVIIRVKKMLGIDTIIEFGEYKDFASRLEEMTSIVTKSQMFGDLYSNSSLKAN